MGGMNHQPTHPRLTPTSAWLSQRVGEGFALALRANGHLEDAIIIGFDKLHVEGLTANLVGKSEKYIRKCQDLLKKSQIVIEQIQDGFRHLHETADIEGYKGNPLAPKVSSYGLSLKFNRVLILPAINVQVWNDLETRISSQNILATLQWEATQFDQLVVPTNDLITVLEECVIIAESKGGRAFAEAVENNEIPLRQYYARVFSLWNYLHAMFLYSALVMTELYYRANEYPSLLEFEAVCDVPTALRKS